MNTNKRFIRMAEFINNRYPNADFTFKANKLMTLCEIEDEKEQERLAEAYEDAKRDRDEDNRR